MNVRRCAGPASLALLGVLLLATSAWGRAQGERPRVYVAEISGVINPLSAEYLDRAIGDAERDGAAALVLRLDTPGGLDTAMRSMVQRIFASRVPVIVYVSPIGARAASAGLFVTMAGHVAAMAPGTNIGAAHPVSLEGPTDPTMSEKVEADAAAYIRSLSETRKRNIEWPERAVRDSVSASASEALELGVIDLVAADLPELLQTIHGRLITTEAGPVMLNTAGAEIVPHPMNFAEGFLHRVTEPNIALALLGLGTIGIMAEFYHPGAFAPGITGTICLILGWVALGSLPTNWGGAALLMLAFVLLVIEVQSHGSGLLTVAAAICFTLGSLLLFRPLGNISPSAPDIGLNPLSVAATGGLLGAFVLVALRAIARSRDRPLLSGAESMVGQLGLAVQDVNPRGVVRVGSEDWSAVANDRPLQAGEPAQIVRVEGVTLVVEPVDAGSDSPPSNPEVLPSAAAPSRRGTRTRSSDARRRTRDASP